MGRKVFYYDKFKNCNQYRSRVTGLKTNLLDLYTDIKTRREVYHASCQALDLSKEENIMTLFESLIELLNNHSHNTLVIIENRHNFEILETKLFRVIQNFTYKELGTLKVQTCERRIAKCKKYFYIAVDYE